MPMTPHVEKHFTAGDTVRDIVIGMSDGLTVPFALAAGLTGAISQTHLIVTAGVAWIPPGRLAPGRGGRPGARAGFAEIAAGSIAMGLGGYRAARGDAEHYASEKQREELEIVTKAEAEAQEVRDIFQTYGLTPEECHTVVESLRQRPQAWGSF